ncbi:MAG: 50S ribosomal protein L32 [Deltaproteobacteria bacterium]|nr:50S ribosomal protein L32 [Deltaproteobacteria bacterium]
MPVPKKRTSHSKRNMRRSHHALEARHAVICPNCGEPTLRHRACSACGQYRGRQIFEAKSEK